MTLHFDRVEVEILSWLKHKPNEEKSVAEFLEMFKDFYEGTEAELQNVFNMLENENLIYSGGTTDKGHKAYSILREGLVAYRSAPPYLL